MKIFRLILCLFFAHCLSVSAETDPKYLKFFQESPHFKKISSSLLKIRLALEQGGDFQKIMETCAPYAMRGNQLQCIVGVSQISSDLINACTFAGLSIQGTYSFRNLNQIVVRCSNPRQFDDLALRPDVVGITLEPFSSRWAETVENEANVSIRAAEARQKYGVDGKGIRIGVLSDSVADKTGKYRIFDGFILGSPSQAKKELPIKIRVVDLGNGSGEDEGSAMMELINDIAPGADLSFAAAEYEYSAFANNIPKLWNDPGYPCQILVDDISFLNEPIYQHGPIALAAMDAVANGVSYFAAAGNFDRNAHERPYTKAKSGEDFSYPPSGANFHDFGAAYDKSSETYLTLRMKQYSILILALHWDEPYGGVLASGPGAQSDLDLYLVSDKTLPLREGANGNILASSVDFQGTVDDPSGEPVEFIYYINTEKERDVHVAVNYQKGRIPQRLHLYVLFSESNGTKLIDRPLVQDRTLIGHMSAPGVVSVSAMPIREIDRKGEYIDPIETLNVAEYSAYGGNLPILFSDDGMERYLTPQSIVKPDFTGPDNTSTSVPGFETFSGTSAAAANVAAVAALMLQYKSELTPNQLYEALRASAIDVENPGQDYRSGWGLVDAYNVLQYLSPSLIPFFTVY